MQIYTTYIDKAEGKEGGNRDPKNKTKMFGGVNGVQTKNIEQKFGTIWLVGEIKLMKS
jgi:hypothetical protein